MPKSFLPLSLLFAAAQAAAQLGGLPRLPGVPALPSTSIDAGRAGRALDRLPAVEVRREAVQALLRRADRFEADPRGEPLRRRELVWHDPDPAALAAALAEGFVLRREQVLEGLGQRLVVLAAPPGLATAQALARLRALDPGGGADFNHVYTGGGALGAGGPVASPAAVAPAGGLRIGLIDGGVDLDHPVLRDADIRPRGCGGPPSAHGTAVASLLVGRGGGVRGALPGAVLYAADVQCSDGAVDAIADALAWLVRERVPVVNVSLVGPANRTLERVVHAVAARGHLVVAAVGNDGPAAPPLYPAAYPGAVGVTAVDARRQVVPEALQGSQVAFAATGVDVLAAAPGGRRAGVRGTSFAAPVVAAALARRLPAPDADAARRVLAELAGQAEDLGEPGRDPVYGHGWIGPASALAGR